MSGEILKIDPEVFRTTTTAFSDVVDALNRLQANEPVGDAAAAAGQLLTAQSCSTAQDGITAAVVAVVDSVRQFGESLEAVMRAYSSEDQAGADDIEAVDTPT